MKIQIKVAPNAKKSEIVGTEAGVLKIKLKAPPVDGKANIELIKFLSDYLEIPKSQITILHGESSRTKLVEVPDSVKDKLA